MRKATKRSTEDSTKEKEDTEHNLVISLSYTVFIPESYGYWTERSNAKYGRNPAIMAKIL